MSAKSVTWFLMIGFIGVLAVLLARDPRTNSFDPAVAIAPSVQPASATVFGDEIPSTEPTRSAVDAGTEAAAIAESEPAQEVSSVGNLELEQIVRIPIPPDLRSWLAENNPGLLEFHDSLEREPRDPEWALRLESELQDFIDSRPNLANIDVYSLECRSASCEVLAMGYGDDAFRTWMTEMSEIFMSDEWLEERIRQGPGETSCGGGNVAPGVMALECVLRSGEALATDMDSTKEFPVDLLLAENLTAESNEDDRIPVPEAMVPLFEEDRELTDLHLRMESEPVDHSWSVFMENQIAEYLLGRPALEGLSVVLTECRMTLCQIQVTSQDEAALFNWTLEQIDFYRQTWHDLAPAGVASGETASGEFGMIWILERRNEGQQGRDVDASTLGA